MYWWNIWELCKHSSIGWLNTLRPRQNGRHFTDDIFKCIFLTGNVWIAIKISFKFVPKIQINNIPTLVQIMAWCGPGNKPLSELMLLSLLTHICITRPQWVNWNRSISQISMHQSHIQQYTTLEQKCAHFSSKVVHCGICGRTIVRSVRLMNQHWFHNGSLRHVYGYG